MHTEHDHIHWEGCEHTALRHDDHVCYLHEGHMHVVGDGEVVECRIAVTGENPDGCRPAHDCTAHDAEHRHGESCGHEKVPHGDHFDYLVDGHLHHACPDHCDDHGPVKLV
jgi:hypothetical protein